MTEDTNAAILAELKKLNEQLSYIKAIAQRFNEKENSRLRGVRELQGGIPHLNND